MTTQNSNKTGAVNLARVQEWPNDCYGGPAFYRCQFCNEAIAWDRYGQHQCQLTKLADLTER